MYTNITGLLNGPISGLSVVAYDISLPYRYGTVGTLQVEFSGHINLLPGQDLQQYDIGENTLQPSTLQQHLTVSSYVTLLRFVTFELLALGV